MISTIALVVSIMGSGYLQDNIHPGEIKLIEPLEYAILNNSHDEDVGYNVILPLEWVNTYKSERLIVRNVHINTSQNISNHIKLSTFNLMGEYPSISNKSFSEDYTIRHSFILDPNSISEKILVFKSDDPISYINSSQPVDISIGFQAFRPNDFTNNASQSAAKRVSYSFRDISASSPHVHKIRLSNGATWYDRLIEYQY